MIPMTINDVVMTMTVCLFCAGVISLGAGIFILISRVLNEDLRTVTSQVAEFSDKGLSEDISGLVGNAASLIDSMNQLIKTTSGIGSFLIIIGILLCVAAYMLLLQIH